MCAQVFAFSTNAGVVCVSSAMHVGISKLSQENGEITLDRCRNVMCGGGCNKDVVPHCNAPSVGEAVLLSRRFGADVS